MQLSLNVLEVSRSLSNSNRSISYFTITYKNIIQDSTQLENNNGDNISELSSVNPMHDGCTKNAYYN